MRKMSNKKNMEKFKRRKPVYDAMRKMPPLSHYPDRSKAWAANDSHVLQWIAATANCDFAEARAIFVAAEKKRDAHIKFDPATKLWKGADL